jgi:CD36 family
MDLSVRAGRHDVSRRVFPCTSPTFAGNSFTNLAPKECRFKIFYPDRSITLDYTETVNNFGISSYRFAGTSRTFANATDNPDNWCFCSGGECNPSGTVNASTCRFGAPVFVSFPHFYLGDPYYVDQVNGLNPEQDRHEFHIDLEPVRNYFAFKLLKLPS